MIAAKSLTPTQLDRVLTPMQTAFVDALVSNGGDKTAAAIEAGYSSDTARTQAYGLLAKPHVIQALMERSMSELASMAPHAINRIRALVHAKSEYVALQASQDILDRLGLRAPDKVDHRVSGEVSVQIDLT
jgi:phage terminase small subunit